jgi:hypothetical protein
MSTEDYIHAYLNSLPEPRRTEMLTLHNNIMQWLPGSKLWFLDGKNSDGKTVANPNIGYGIHTIKYANGSTKEFYQTGISAVKSGISLYIFGIADKNFLSETYSNRLGRANISGYCINFRSLSDLNPEVLEEIIRNGTHQSLSTF